MTAKLTAGVPPKIKTLVDALREMILGRISRLARLINMIDRPMKINQMGDGGQNLHSFSEGLILDMEQSGWVSMTVAEAMVLYWLKDLYASKKNQVDLGDKVH